MAILIICKNNEFPAQRVVSCKKKQRKKISVFRSTPAKKNRKKNNSLPLPQGFISGTKMNETYPPPPKKKRRPNVLKKNGEKAQINKVLTQSTNNRSAKLNSAETKSQKGNVVSLISALSPKLRKYNSKHPTQKLVFCKLPICSRYWQAARRALPLNQLQVAEGTFVAKTRTYWPGNPGSANPRTPAHPPWPKIVPLGRDRWATSSPNVGSSRRRGLCGHLGFPAPYTPSGAL